MQVAWNQRQGLQRGGEGANSFLHPAAGGSQASPDTGLGVMLQAAALQYGFIRALGGSACRWLFYKMNCKKNDLSAGVLAAALKQCIASLRLFPWFTLAGR